MYSYVAWIKIRYKGNITCVFPSGAFGSRTLASTLVLLYILKQCGGCGSRPFASAGEYESPAFLEQGPQTRQDKWGAQKENQDCQADWANCSQFQPRQSRTKTHSAGDEEIVGAPKGPIPSKVHVWCWLQRDPLRAQWREEEHPVGPFHVASALLFLWLLLFNFQQVAVRHTSSAVDWKGSLLIVLLLCFLVRVCKHDPWIHLGLDFIPAGRSTISDLCEPNPLCWGFKILEGWVYQRIEPARRWNCENKPQGASGTQASWRRSWGGCQHGRCCFPGPSSSFAVGCMFLWFQSGHGTLGEWLREHCSARWSEEE